MTYLEGLHKHYFKGRIQYAGTMDIVHEADSIAANKKFYTPTSEWGVKMMSESQLLYGVPCFRFKLDYADGCGGRKWGEANTNAIYWLCVEVLNSIGDLNNIIKIGQTSNERGVYGRFSNYSAGIFYRGGQNTNIAVYKAMMTKGVSRVFVYYELQKPIPAIIEPWGVQEETTVNMLIREKSHTAMYKRYNDGKLPIGNKQ